LGLTSKTATTLAQDENIASLVAQNAVKNQATLEEEM